MIVAREVPLFEQPVFAQACAWHAFPTAFLPPRGAGVSLVNVSEDSNGLYFPPCPGLVPRPCNSLRTIA